MQGYVAVARLGLLGGANSTLLVSSINTLLTLLTVSLQWVLVAQWLDYNTDKKNKKKLIYKLTLVCYLQVTICFHFPKR